MRTQKLGGILAASLLIGSIATIAGCAARTQKNSHQRHRDPSGRSICRESFLSRDGFVPPGDLLGLFGELR